MQPASLTIDLPAHNHETRLGPAPDGLFGDLTRHGEVGWGWAPGAARQPEEVWVASQGPPYLVRGDIAEHRGEEGSGLGRVPAQGRPVEGGEDPALGRRVIAGLGARTGRVDEPGQSVAAKRVRHLLTRAGRVRSCRAISLVPMPSAAASGGGT
jgi:hypothetical protein